MYCCCVLHSLLVSLSCFIMHIYHYSAHTTLLLSDGKKRARNIRVMGLAGSGGVSPSLAFEIRSQIGQAIALRLSPPVLGPVYPTPHPASPHRPLWTRFQPPACPARHRQRSDEHDLHPLAHGLFPLPARLAQGQPARSALRPVRGGATLWPEPPTIQSTRPCWAARCGRSTSTCMPWR